MKSVNVCLMDGNALFQISSMSNETHEKVASAVSGAQLSEVTDNRPNYAFKVAVQNLDIAAPALNAIDTLLTVKEIGAENRHGERNTFLQLIDAARFTLTR